MTEENAPWGKAGGAHKDSCEERLQAEDVCTSSWCISAGSISLENGLRSRNALGRTRVILAHDAEKRVKVGGRGQKKSNFRNNDWNLLRSRLSRTDRVEKGRNLQRKKIAED